MSSFYRAEKLRSPRFWWLHLKKVRWKQSPDFIKKIAIILIIRNGSKIEWEGNIEARLQLVANFDLPKETAVFAHSPPLLPRMAKCLNGQKTNNPRPLIAIATNIAPAVAFVGVRLMSAASSSSAGSLTIACRSRSIRWNPGSTSPAGVSLYFFRGKFAGRWRYYFLPTKIRDKRM